MAAGLTLVGDRTKFHSSLQHHYPTTASPISGLTAVAPVLWEGLSSLHPARGNMTRSERQPGA